MWLPIFFFLNLCRSVINAAPDFTFVSPHLSKSREHIYLRLKSRLCTFVNTVGCACLEERALILGRFQTRPIFSSGSNFTYSFFAVSFILQIISYLFILSFFSFYLITSFLMYLYTYFCISCIYVSCCFSLYFCLLSSLLPLFVFILLSVRVSVPQQTLLLYVVCISARDEPG